jgi:hypothetical protein
VVRLLTFSDGRAIFAEGIAQPLVSAVVKSPVAAIIVPTAVVPAPVAPIPPALVVAVPATVALPTAVAITKPTEVAAMFREVLSQLPAALDDLAAALSHFAAQPADLSPAGAAPLGSLKRRAVLMVFPHVPAQLSPVPLYFMPVLMELLPGGGPARMFEAAVAAALICLSRP